MANIIIGHEVDRLLVAHCEQNPIEMAWSQVKGHVKWNNRKYNIIVMDIVTVCVCLWKVYFDQSYRTLRGRDQRKKCTLLS